MSTTHTAMSLRERARTARINRIEAETRQAEEYRARQRQDAVDGMKVALSRIGVDNLIGVNLWTVEAPNSYEAWKAYAEIDGLTFTFWENRSAYGNSRYQLYLCRRCGDCEALVLAEQLCDIEDLGKALENENPYSDKLCYDCQQKREEAREVVREALGPLPVTDTPETILIKAMKGYIHSILRGTEDDDCGYEGDGE